MRRLLPRQRTSGEERGTSPPAWEQYRKQRRTQHERDDNDTNDVDRAASSGSTPPTPSNDATLKGKGKENEKNNTNESRRGDATECALHNSSRRVQELFNEFQNPFWLLLADVTDAEFDKLVDYLETIEAETE